MARHPRNSVIFQYTGLVIDLDSVDHAALLEPTDDDNHFYIMVSFRASPKIAKLRVKDFEHGMVIISRIKRGMISAMNGDYHLLDDDEPPDHEEYKDGEEPTTNPES